MKQLMRHIFIYTVCALCGVACQLDELCYDHTHYPYVEISVDLSATEGISITKNDQGYYEHSYGPLTFEQDLLSYKAIFFPVDDGFIDLEDLDNNIQTFRMQNSWDFKVSVIPGTYDVLLYSDYSGQISFSNILDYDNIYAEAITSKSLTSVRATGDDTSLIAMPDQMVVGKVEGFVVEDLGVNANDLSYNNPTKLNFEGVQSTDNVMIKFWIRNSNSISTLSTYVYEVDRKYYISSQSSTDGGYDMYIYDDNVRYNSYTETYFVPAGQEGNLESYTNTWYYREYIIDALTFGLSDLDNRGIYFDITLKDGSKQEVEFFNFDLGEIEYTSDNTITYVMGSMESPLLILPEMISSDDGTGGFSPGVGDWDDEDEYEVTLQ